MKKLVLLLAVVFGVSLVSCNGGAKEEAAAADTTATETEVVVADSAAAATDSVATDSAAVAADSTAVKAEAPAEAAK